MKTVTLNRAHTDYLAERGVTRTDVLTLRGYETIDKSTNGSPAWLPDSFGKAGPVHDHTYRSAALLIPIFGEDPDEEIIHQIKFDKVRDERGKKGPKFEMAYGVDRGVNVGDLPADVHPIASQAWHDEQANHSLCASEGVHLVDCELEGQTYKPYTIIITEGVVKGDAILQAALNEGLRVIPVALTGVTMGFTRNDSGDAKLVESLRWITEGQNIVIAFDADFASNQSVASAIYATEEALIDAGAASVNVMALHLCGDPTKSEGIDDILADGVTLTELLTKYVTTAAEIVPLPGRLAGESADLPVMDGSQFAVATRIAAYFRDPAHTFRLVRSGSERSWWRWDGAVYAPDPDGAMRAAIEISRRCADQMDKPNEKRTLLSDGSIRACLRLAESMDGVAVRAEDMDEINPEIISTPDGILELRGLTFRAATPDDLVTKVTAGRFRPLENEDATWWWANLVADTLSSDGRKVATDEDNAIVKAYQMWAGAGVTGHPLEHLFVHYGGGSDGKSSLVNGLLRAMGTWGGEANPDHLLNPQASGSAEYERAELRGKRFVALAESGKHLDSGSLKKCVSNDKVVGRRIKCDPITFAPTWILASTTNTLPSLTEAAKRSTQRRLGLVTFKRHFPNDGGVIRDRLANDQDTIDAVFTWMCFGAMAWLDGGRQIPTCDRIERDTTAWLKDNDPFGQFAEGYLVEDPEGWIDKATLTRGVNDYMKEEGMRYGETAKRIVESLEGWIGHKLKVVKVSYPRIYGVSWTEKGKASLGLFTPEQKRRAGTVCVVASDAEPDPDLEPIIDVSARPIRQRSAPMPVGDDSGHGDRSGDFG